LNGKAAQARVSSDGDIGDGDLHATPIKARQAVMPPVRAAVGG